jgi:molecular chaperone Hsp31 and glyoxalase 3
MTKTQDDKRPTPDAAEHNAFFPSPYSLSQFTAPRSDLSDADYPDAYRGGRWKVLMIAADERYLQMDNGTLFSTGNHPIETLVPMAHLDAAGFDIDVATLSGNPVKLELWAFPRQDEVIQRLYGRYLERFLHPKRLADVVAEALGADSDYIAVFIPGGHGALIGLPESTDVQATLDWALAQDRHIVSLCHGPAALLAAGIDRSAQDYPLSGYRIQAFPDAMDRQTPEIGYMPGGMPWFFGDKLRALGVEVLTGDEIDGSTHQDRKLLTGDSPLASNALGKLAARALLDQAAGTD